MLSKIINNWPYIIYAMVVFSSILNAITVHFSERQGVKKACLFVLEIFSILTSLGVPGKLKFPLQSVPPTGERSDKILLFLFLIIPIILTSCASTKQTLSISLRATHEAIRLAADLSMPAMELKCKEEAIKCYLAKNPDCDQLLECIAQSKKIQGYIVAAQTIILEATDCISDDKCVEAKIELAKKLILKIKEMVSGT